MENRNQDSIDEFVRRFHSQPTHVAIGPGRVNLIGEHTDYNDGFVLPVAIKRDVRLIFRPRKDKRVRLHSLEYSESFSFELGREKFQPDLLWANYVQGIAWVLREKGIPLTGIDAVISGNVPRGSGLSSSAAIEIATAQALLGASNQLNALPGPQIAKAAQRAENAFVGVNCGIMDQFISMMGAENHALLIDCRSLEYQLAPMPENAALVIGNTKASRSLANSAYNERRSQCEKGVAILQNAYPAIQALRDATLEQLEEQKAQMSEVVYRRCRHVISENARVLQTVEALAQGDLVQVGALMNASHESLRTDYEVSSTALDVMVDAMRSVAGCYGARLTGAGFGGCAVALVEPGKEQVMADLIYEKYPKATQIWPEVYTTKASAGARVEAL